MSRKPIDHSTPELADIVKYMDGAGGENPYLGVDLRNYRIDGFVANKQFVKEQRNAFYEICQAALNNKPNVVRVYIEYAGQQFDPLSGEWFWQTEKLDHLSSLNTIDNTYCDDQNVINLAAARLEKFVYSYCRNNNIIDTTMPDGKLSLIGFSAAFAALIEAAKRDGKIIPGRGI